MMWLCSCVMPLTISEVEPTRITITPSGDPVETSVERKPAPIESSATTTVTTPATPTTVVSEEPRRWPSERRLSAVTLAPWERAFSGGSYSRYFHGQPA